METANQLEIINPASVLNDLELTATLPHEMVNAQQQLITWCDSKIILLKKESQELLEATEHAKKNKWKFTTIQGQYFRSLKQLQYYEKVKAALMEGYYIVPNFPIQMFAIRTKYKSPKKGITTWYADNHEQLAQELQINEGTYKNPFPLQKQRKIKDNEGKDITKYWADDWDRFEFPITMAKPSIMEATSRAMALKIFDRIGIMPEGKKDDPVIIGQILRRNSYTTKIVSFMICWHLNTNVI